MADYVKISEGSGATVATDQISGAHYQRIKLTDGTADSENHWTIDASGRGAISLFGNVTISDSKKFVGLVSVSGFANPLPVSSTLQAGVAYAGFATVEVASIAAGTNYIGSATVNVAGTLPALSAGVAGVGFATVAVGSIAAGTNYIGSATVNIAGTLPALSAGVAGVGFATVSTPNQEYSYTFTSGPTGNMISKASAGFLHAVHVGKAVASGVVEVSDHASDGDGAIVFYLEGDTLGPAVYPVNMKMSTGITTDITTQTHVTIIWR